ncbi:MAG: hypothetical protein O7G87_09355 [bacterium]|nr:hypothetical protein [bacterium]
MKIILLSIIGALILLWGAIYALFIAADREKFTFAKREGEFLKLRKEYFWALGAYLTILTSILIYLVLQTSLTRQEHALNNTQDRFYKQMDDLRENFGQQTEKLMGQLEEKAKLTGSELEVREKLRSEIDQHKRSRQELADARSHLQITQQELLKESDAHRNYLDQFNTEKALHKKTRDLFANLEKRHNKTQSDLRNTRRDLNKTREQSNQRKQQRDKLENTLKKAQENVKRALANNKRLFQEANKHQEGLTLLQATADSIFKKVLKRPRVPEPEPASQK